MFCFLVFGNLKNLINTFTSEKTNKPFSLENALNFRHEFLYDNLSKKIQQNPLVKILIEKLICQI